MGCQPKSDPTKTPFGLNRYVLFVLYLWVVFIAGSVYWGWDGLQGLLYRSEAYKWRCQDADEQAEWISLNGVDYINCDDRKTSINNLYTAAFASNYIFSVVCGTVLDSQGPKIAMCLGLLIAALGWALLCVSSQSFPAYYAGMVFIGISADMIYFPVLVLANLFQDKQMLVFGIMGSMRSVSFSIPVILNLIAVSMDLSAANTMNVAWAYVIFGLGSSLIIAMLTAPWHPFVVVDNSPSGIADAKQVEENITMASSPSRSVNGEEMADINQERRRSSLKQDNQNDGVVATSESVPPKSDSKSFGLDPQVWLALKSPSYWAGILFFASGLLRAEFYTKSNKDQLIVDGQDVYYLFSIFNIISFIPGPFLGWMCDNYNLQAAQVVMNTSMVLQYFFVLFNNITMKALSAVCLFVSNAFVISNLYCFVRIYFPAEHFGKLAGFGSIFAGIMTFMSVGLYSLSAETFDDFNPVNGFMIALGVVGYGLIYFMYRRLTLNPQSRIAQHSAEEGNEIANPC